MKDNLPFTLCSKILSSCTIHEQSLFAQTSKANNALFQKKLNQDLKQLFGIEMPQNPTHDLILQRNSLIKLCKTNIENLKTFPDVFLYLTDLNKISRKNCFAYTQSKLYWCQGKFINEEIPITNAQHLEQFALENTVPKLKLYLPTLQKFIAPNDLERLLYPTLGVLYKHFIREEDATSAHRNNYAKAFLALSYYFQNFLTKKTKNKLMIWFDDEYKKMFNLSDKKNKCLNSEDLNMLQCESSSKIEAYLNKRNIGYELEHVNHIYIAHLGHIAEQKIKFDFNELFKKNFFLHFFVEPKGINKFLKLFALYMSDEKDELLEQFIKEDKKDKKDKKCHIF